MDDGSDVVPLITAQYDPGSGSSPKISAFYDDIENSIQVPDREPSMISMDTNSVALERNSLPQPTNRLYYPPEVENAGSENLSENLSGSYISCQICQTTISIKSLKARVVKCPRCQEGNPIKEPPPGKKYIRCACNCLLVCNNTARAVICPREGCNHRTQLVTPLPTPQLVKENKEPSINCPKCSYNIRVLLTSRQYFRCSRCNTRITSFTKTERSLLLLRYLGFFIIIALLLTTGILILELVPGKIWEPLMFCGLAFGVGFPCLIYRLIPLYKSKPYR
ncbi:type I phosphatidylinositol 4,5-bisphosphate 4-phosphatase-B-like isoform X1 [Bolinopsis microptera]|uniref:type I phosphatidylinositol 4,5-bisphosphate 4-phosphatase-B-like isoform X1 n=1 Tax=Bolinopsis microptera TaxID=2820187 RepID=UPI0030793E9B